MLNKTAMLGTIVPSLLCVASGVVAEDHPDLEDLKNSVVSATVKAYKK